MLARSQTIRAENAWCRSSRCVGEAHCVEWCILGGAVALRNSRDPETVLTFDAIEWKNFTDGVKGNEFSLLN